MARAPINDVLAQNLAYFMAMGPLKTQQALATKSGIAQRTISNYLNPRKRAPGSSGKPPSAKLTELDKVAEALGVDVWLLLRPTTELELKLWMSIERTFHELRNGISSSGTPGQLPLQLHEPTPRNTPPATKLAT
jgi:transcriptional regulator with XRE-family HTH domain